MDGTLAPDAAQVNDVTPAVEISGAPQDEEMSPLAVANSHEANALRAEIIAVGRKLWERKYVDGNGGNISVRIGSRYVLCTPTMVSKGDLEPADICLTDLEGNILFGNRARTSELLLHLQIYRANPRARAVVHCHPPNVTAYAITGTVPPNGLIAEYEMLIGPAALAPYEMPGTRAFAETVLPFVHHHNTILLSNHGVVCWSDTVTHTEWLIEVLDTYCNTLMVARQIGEPLQYLPQKKVDEILAAKRALGYPDIRLSQTHIVPETIAAKKEELQSV